MLDPLVGVSSINDATAYAGFVNPDFVHVSPVFRSDVNSLTPVDVSDNSGAPAVNALGLRRGLLAFRIIAVGADPDGPDGSILPNLVIEVVDPSEIDLNNLPTTPSGGGATGGTTLVR